MSDYRELPPPDEMYQKIRDENPYELFGDHWEGIGVYMGEWGDPKYLGMPGEYEFMWNAIQARVALESPRMPQEQSGKGRR